MISIIDKIRYFDYFISRVIYTVYNNGADSFTATIYNNIDKCGLNKLKLIKLLFFVSAKEVNGKYLLDDIFNNFYAMPYGPVESDIYNHLTELPNYNIGNNAISFKEHADINYTDSDVNYKRIDNSVIAVYNLNDKLFSMNTFDLVELSHRADSWRIAFAEAQRQGKNSIKIPNDIIKQTTVYYK